MARKTTKDNTNHIRDLEYLRMHSPIAGSVSSDGLTPPLNVRPTVLLGMSTDMGYLLGSIVSSCSEQACCLLRCETFTSTHFVEAEPCSELCGSMFPSVEDPSGSKSITGGDAKPIAAAD
jgi:hypothetical protein